MLSGLRLSDQERAAITKAMDATDGIGRRGNRPEPVPADFALVMRVAQMGAEPVAFQVSARDLCPAGVGFFHAGYLHVGTPAVFMMRNLEGHSVTIPGRVTACEHRSGRIHELAAEFDERIIVADYVNASSPASLVADEFGGDPHAEITELVGEIKAMSDAGAEPARMLRKVKKLEQVLEGKVGGSAQA